MTLIDGTSASDSPAEASIRTDAELITRSAEVRENFGVLFDRHAAALHRYLARRVGDPTAEDLVAQAFLVAFERRDRYDAARAEARAWLFGIATNLLRRHHRDEARLLRALARTGTDPVTDPGPAERVASRVDANRSSRRLAAVLADLPGRERDVLLLYAWADMGPDEISRVLDIPVGTVRSRLHRARKRLRPLLDVVQGEDLAVRGETGAAQRESAQKTAKEMLGDG
ncbi:RNA polymerase sigma factor [Dactylosporangium sp. NPDC051485]|uniref:RNA polymerase sigma factor n=1 Tax=Dactylosporangium sp. NPDC051485 TaxID=3154846 RepID=UPI00342A13B3